MADRITSKSWTSFRQARVTTRCSSGCGRVPEATDCKPLWILVGEVASEKSMTPYARVLDDYSPATTQNVKSRRGA